MAGDIRRALQKRAEIDRTDRTAPDAEHVSRQHSSTRIAQHTACLPH